MRYAIVENGIVTNVVLWDGEAEHPDAARLVLCGEEVSVRWTREGDVWVAPPPLPLPDIDPEEEARRQAHRDARDKAARQLGLTPEEALALFNGA